MHEYSHCSAVGLLGAPALQWLCLPFLAVKRSSINALETQMTRHNVWAEWNLRSRLYGSPHTLHPITAGVHIYERHKTTSDVHTSHLVSSEAICSSKAVLIQNTIRYMSFRMQTRKPGCYAVKCTDYTCLAPFAASTSTTSWAPDSCYIRYHEES